MNNTNTNKNKNIPLTWLVIVFIVFLLLGMLVASITRNYTIIEEQDLSYKGCKRLVVNVIVKNATTNDKIDVIADEILQNKTSGWEDTTIWVYKKENEDKIGNTSYAVLEKSESICN